MAPGPDPRGQPVAAEALSIPWAWRAAWRARDGRLASPVRLPPIDCSHRNALPKSSLRDIAGQVVPPVLMRAQVQPRRAVREFVLPVFSPPISVPLQIPIARVFRSRLTSSFCVLPIGKPAVELTGHVCGLPCRGICRWQHVTTEVIDRHSHRAVDQSRTLQEQVCRNHSPSAAEQKHRMGKRFVIARKKKKMEKGIVKSSCTGRLNNSSCAAALLKAHRQSVDGVDVILWGSGLPLCRGIDTCPPQIRPAR